MEAVGYIGALDFVVVAFIYLARVFVVDDSVLADRVLDCYIVFT